MNLNFGSGPTLFESVPWLRDDEQRIAIILEVTECNSVIEGLPPFTEATRRQIRSELVALTASEARQR